MTACNIDHSQEDVIKKLENQKDFLPEDIAEKTVSFLEEKRSQEVLNEVFHLLKKYDLASESERNKRNEELREITN